MYDYKLNKNTLNAETYWLLPTHWESWRSPTYMCDAPLSMTSSDLCAIDYEFVVQVTHGYAVQ